jgi:hypothetical protein
MKSAWVAPEGKDCWFQRMMGRETRAGQKYLNETAANAKRGTAGGEMN